MDNTTTGDYYSSDEEVAWGRLTLREIKKDLQCSKKITHRKSDSEHTMYFTPSTTFSEKVEENVNTSSAASSYFTPNVSVSKKNVFLENVAKVINNEDCKEETEAEDTMLKILEDGNEREYILDNIQQILLDNTVKSPEVAEDHCNIPTCNVEDSYEDDGYSVITISDDSSYSSHEQSYEDSPVHVKTENQSTDLAVEGNQCKSQSNLDEGEDNTNRLINLQKLDLSGLAILNSENNTTVEDSYNSEDSHVFNDTIEEMERALKYGVDYHMPGENSITSSSTQSPPKHTDASITSTSTKSSSPKHTQIPVLKKTVPKIPNKFDYIQSPVAGYIKRKSPKHETFKVPVKPVKPKAMTPNTKSPMFKGIISPVGVYIKNSPAGCLQQNVPTRTIPVLRTSSKCLIQQNKENVGLPQVAYRPARKVVEAVHRDVVLPNNIQSLVSEPMISAREAKFKNHQRTLSDGDLTLMNATLNQTEGDISFVVTKQAFIK